MRTGPFCASNAGMVQKLSISICVMWAQRNKQSCAVFILWRPPRHDGVVILTPKTPVSGKIRHPCSAEAARGAYAHALIGFGAK